MRSHRLLPIGLLLITAAAVGACAGAAPGWTYAPAPSITAAPSVEPSASAAASVEPSAAPSGSAEASTAPSAPASASASAAPSAAPSGDLVVLDIAALNVLFDTDALAAPADVPFQIRFANNDAGIPHNVEIKDASGATVLTDTPFKGVETRTYDAGPLAAGQYPFLCIVHPTTMAGTLTVGG